MSSQAIGILIIEIITAIGVVAMILNEHKFIEFENKIFDKIVSTVKRISWRKV